MIRFFFSATTPAVAACGALAAVLFCGASAAMAQSDASDGRSGAARGVAEPREVPRLIVEPREPRRRLTQAELSAEAAEAAAAAAAQAATQAAAQTSAQTSTMSPATAASTAVVPVAPASIASPVTTPASVQPPVAALSRPAVGEVTPPPSLSAPASTATPAPVTPIDASARPAAPARPEESGIATVYASEIAGELTASGERYAPDELTAAHRTLPIGTIVRVVHTASGRSVRVRINDRWGGGAGRVVNLSRRAADDLGFGRAGQLAVDLFVETIGSGPVGNVPPAGERLVARVDVATSGPAAACANQGRILGLRDQYLRNHIANCMARAQRR